MQMEVQKTSIVNVASLIRMLQENFVNMRMLNSVLHLTGMMQLSTIVQMEEPVLWKDCKSLFGKSSSFISNFTFDIHTKC